MEVVDVADEIFRELNEPSDISIASLTFWLESNLGKLNTFLYASFIIQGGIIGFINCDDEFEPFSDKAKDIFKEIYFIKYYKRQITKSLGAGGVEWTMLREGDSLVRRTSKTDVAKVYQSLVNTHTELLKDLIMSYRKGVFNPEGINLF